MVMVVTVRVETLEVLLVVGPVNVVVVATVILELYGSTTSRF